MKTMIAVLGVCAALQAQAVEQNIIDGFASFDRAGRQLMQLAAAENVFPATQDEVRCVIAGWSENDFRRKALALLAGYGFDLTRAKEAVVIEWGGGGTVYRALYLSDRNFFFRKADKRNLVMEEIRPADTVFREVARIRSIVGGNNYRGNLSGFSCDVPTCVVTLLGREEKTAILYGGAAIRLKSQPRLNDHEKDTAVLWDTLDEIRKRCGIPPESGA